MENMTKLVLMTSAECETGFIGKGKVILKPNICYICKSQL